MTSRGGYRLLDRLLQFSVKLLQNPSAIVHRLPGSSPSSHRPPMEQDTQWLYQLLADVQLEKFYLRVRDGLNITRIEHFAYVKEGDLEHIGISKPAQRRLWDALKRYKTSRNWRSGGPSGRAPDGSGGGEHNLDGGSRALPSLIQDCELVLGERLGSGSFGVVKKGEWHTPTGRVLPVAVKSLRSSMSRHAETLTDFLQEVTSMQSLDHPHIIRLYGVVLTQPLKMVTELAPLGSLYDTLRSRQYEYPLARLWLFACQIAAGMDYLETRRFIHRDLAARNVLLASKDMVKIGDFGLMRGLSHDADHYIMSAHRRIPFAWCAPESLRVGSFSHASDVWMYGVTLWEMFTYCEEPWFGLSGRQREGERLEKPPDSPQELYAVMRKCWACEPAERPDFARLIAMVTEAKPMEVQAGREFSEARKLALAPGDLVTVVEHGLEHTEWRGQNQRTLNVGWFPPCRLRRWRPRPVSCRLPAHHRPTSSAPIGSRRGGLPCTRSRAPSGRRHHLHRRGAPTWSKWPSWHVPHLSWTSTWTEKSGFAKGRSPLLCTTPETRSSRRWSTFFFF
uniref:Tyrosine kinase, non-receptor, 1 n=1 Tax=Hippocampus comes TaxID=109280 RepID=A0A3Q2YYZ9_HIPCM